jgi:hypothetical protein
MLVRVFEPADITKSSGVLDTCRRLGVLQHHAARGRGRGVLARARTDPQGEGWSSRPWPARPPGRRAARHAVLLRTRAALMMNY